MNTLQSPDAKTDSTVLIDTWWNVNKILAIKSHKILTVLIDTWWNVNYVSFQLYLPRIGFNRYMVECESVLW